LVQLIDEQYIKHNLNQKIEFRFINIIQNNLTYCISNIQLNILLDILGNCLNIPNIGIKFNMSGQSYDKQPEIPDSFQSNQPKIK
jgi:hypothetical protein